MKIVRTKETSWTEALTKGRFANRRKELGGERLSCGLWELPPGKKSFPLHMHHVTEEAMFVISGRGKVRTPEGESQIGEGDFVSFPPGGPAHQLINDSNEPLVYLAMSSGMGVDIVEYPESGKVASSVGKYPTGRRFMFRKDSQVEYLDGEKDGE